MGVHRGPGDADSTRGALICAGAPHSPPHLPITISRVVLYALLPYPQR
jgi:hypothetical protein